MKAISSEYYIERTVKLKKGVKFKKVKDMMPHPMCGEPINYTMRVCPHNYAVPGDVPFHSIHDFKICPKKCFRIVTKSLR